MPQVVNLRPFVLDLIRQVRYPDKSGGVLTISTSEHGDTEITNNEGQISFSFPKYKRLFVLGAGGVLVEKVKVPDPTDKPEVSQLEQEFLTLIREDNYPDQQGETIPVPYGPDDDICMLTRTPTGVLGEFLTEGKKLLYDMKLNRIRPYVESHIPARQRDAAKKREERARDTDPDMVEQQGYDGKAEMVDRRLYCNKVVCECGAVRWVKNSDLFQVSRCKPCTKKQRKKTPK